MSARSDTFECLIKFVNLDQNGFLIWPRDSDKIGRVKIVGNTQFSHGSERGVTICLRISLIERIEIKRFRTKMVNDGTKGETRAPRRCEICHFDPWIRLNSGFAP
jgi:hypothetical protein